MTRPCPATHCRAASSATRSALGVWAKSTIAVKGCPSSRRSMRPGTPGTAAIPSATASSGIPSASDADAAAKILLTLNAPTSGEAISTFPHGLRSVARIPCGL